MAGTRGARRHPDIRRQPVDAIMQPAFPFADISTPVELLSDMITPENPAVLVRDFKTDKMFIIPRRQASPSSRPTRLAHASRPRVDLNEHGPVLD